MSVTENTLHTEGRESGLLHGPELAVRVFATELSAGDGRTVDLRIVPYGERAKANDGLGGFPVGVMYEEEILPGAFDHQLNAANRVHMNVEHEPGILGVVGRGLALASRSDGFYGSFRCLETHAGDTALALVREGALGGVSFEAKFRKSVRAASGVIQRVKADLVNIALCRDPAYKSAVILGTRTEVEDEFILDESLLPIPFDPERAARIAALGIALPEHLQAHPDTDTSAEADTSDTAPAIDDPTIEAEVEAQ